MKTKLIFTIPILALLLSTSIFAADKNSEEVWKDIGEQGKKALQETGKFFKEAGTEIGNFVKDAFNDVIEVKCYGTWVYKNKNCSTTITCKENGMMEIIQKEGLNTKYWKGDFSVTAKFITFFISEEGSETMFVKTKPKEKVSKKWFLTYKVKEPDLSIIFTSTDIPEDLTGTDFSEGVVFSKK